jgi:hypothetical protein
MTVTVGQRAQQRFVDKAEDGDIAPIASAKNNIATAVNPGRCEAESARHIERLATYLPFLLNASCPQCATA